MLNAKSARLADWFSLTGVVGPGLRSAASTSTLTAQGHRFMFALVVTNANYWTALGDPTRRTIFELLVEQPCSVSGLARALPVTRPAVSQHLKVLKDAGLVADTRSGKERIYRIDQDGLASLRAEIDQYWSKTLAGYKLAVEHPKKDQA